VTFPTDDDEFSSVCPYLGLADDADSHATYATEAHRCYRLDNPTRIATNHPDNFCLGANHIACPVFKGEGIAATTQQAAPAAAAAGGAAFGGASSGRGRGSRQPAQPPVARTRAAPGDRPRKPPTGTIGPRPRPGGISMPVATIGLFALAIIVIAIAFLIQGAVGSGGDKPSPAEVNQTNTAVAKDKTPGSQTQAPGTAAAGQPTTSGTTAPGTPKPSTTPQAGNTPAGGASTYTVQSGDFCGTIAEKNGITLDQFFSLNPNIDRSCNNLTVGQVVKVK
jgi:LysM repeat protein